MGPKIVAIEVLWNHGVLGIGAVMFRVTAEAPQFGRWYMAFRFAFPKTDEEKRKFRRSITSQVRRRLVKLCKAREVAPPGQIKWPREWPNAIGKTWFALDEDRERHNRFWRQG